MNPAISILLLIGIVVLGGLLAQWLPWSEHKSLWKQRVIPFTGAFLLGVVILHIFPEVYHGTERTVALFVLLGFGIQIVLDVFSKGIEHGHIHIQSDHMSKQVTSILLALSVHAFLEGLPLSSGSESLHQHDHHHSYLWAVVFHKLPAAFTLATMLRMIYRKSIKGWLLLLVFAVMTPLGQLVGIWIDISSSAYAYIMALVAGSLLHVSTTIIFEIDSKGSHDISLDRLAAIALGLLVAYLSIAL